MAGKYAFGYSDKKIVEKAKARKMTYAQYFHYLDMKMRTRTKRSG